MGAILGATLACASFAPISLHAGPVAFCFTNSLNQPDTNAFRIVSIQDYVNADGSFIVKGLPIRATPGSNGRYTNNLALGHYLITNNAVAVGFLIRVFDSGPTVYQATADSAHGGLAISGFNTFVTISYGTNLVTLDMITNAIGGAPVLFFIPTNGVSIRTGNTFYFTTNVPPEFSPGANITFTTNGAVITIASSGGSGSGVSGTGITNAIINQGAANTNDAISRAASNTNFTLTVGANDTNAINSHAASNTNFTLAVGANTTNGIVAQGAANTNDAIARAASNTNFTLTIGANDTNAINSHAASNTNFTLTIGANTTNAIVAQGAANTNDAIARAASNTNFTLTIGANDTNAINSHAASNTNFTLTVGANTTNGIVAQGAANTNDAIARAGSNTNFTLTVGLSVSNNIYAAINYAVSIAGGNTNKLVVTNCNVNIVGTLVWNGFGSWTNSNNIGSCTNIAGYYYLMEGGTGRFSGPYPTGPWTSISGGATGNPGSVFQPFNFETNGTASGIGLNNTNFTLTVGANTTNGIVAQGAANTNDAIARSASNTNFTLTIGANDTNAINSHAASNTNFTLTIGANTTNAIVAQGASNTNDAIARAASNTNFTLTVGANDTNAINSHAASNTNFTLTVGANTTNGIVAQGAANTNDAIARAGSNTNFTLTVGANLTNNANLNLFNNTNLIGGVIGTRENYTNQTIYISGITVPAAANGYYYIIGRFNGDNLYYNLNGFLEFTNAGNWNIATNCIFGYTNYFTSPTPTGNSWSVVNGGSGSLVAIYTNSPVMTYQQQQTLQFVLNNVVGNFNGNATNLNQVGGALSNVISRGGNILITNQLDSTFSKYYTFTFNTNVIEPYVFGTPFDLAAFTNRAFWNANLDYWMNTDGATLTHYIGGYTNSFGAKWMFDPVDQFWVGDTETNLDVFDFLIFYFNNSSDITNNSWGISLGTTAGGIAYQKISTNFNAGITRVASAQTADLSTNSIQAYYVDSAAPPVKTFQGRSHPFVALSFDSSQTSAGSKIPSYSNVTNAISWRNNVSGIKDKIDVFNLDDAGGNHVSDYNQYYNDWTNEMWIITNAFADICHSNSLLASVWMPLKGPRFTTNNVIYGYPTNFWSTETALIDSGVDMIKWDVSFGINSLEVSERRANAQLSEFGYKYAGFVGKQISFLVPPPPEGNPEPLGGVLHGNDFTPSAANSASWLTTAVGSGNATADNPTNWARSFHFSMSANNFSGGGSYPISGTGFNTFGNTNAFMRLLTMSAVARQSIIFSATNGLTNLIYTAFTNDCWNTVIKDNSGKAGYLVWRNPASPYEEIWSYDMTDGGKAVGIYLNATNGTTMSAYDSIDINLFGIIPTNKTVYAYDQWSGTNYVINNGRLNLIVSNPFGVQFWKLYPQASINTTTNITGSSVTGQMPININGNIYYIDLKQ